MPPEAPTRHWLRAEWPGPARAVMTTRAGGASSGPYRAFNLGDRVGDAPEAVAANRGAFATALGAMPVWLHQVHGSRVVRVGAGDAAPGAPVLEADASLTTEPGVACCVLVADCLPVLLAAPAGRGVAAAHAGWRGLAGGVVENVLRGLCEASGCEPQEIAAWFGACIGPSRFEVGADVLAAFPGAAPGRFVASAAAADGSPRWRADLAGLARDRLAQAGVVHAAGSTACTVLDSARFFSFRRDGVCGRMAGAVWLDG